MYIAKTFRKRGVKFAPISFLKNINQLPFISPIRFLTDSLNQQVNPPAIPYISVKSSRHLPFIYAIKVVASNLKELLNPPAIPYFGKTIETLTFHICNQGSGEQHCEPAGTKTMLFRFSVPLRGSHSESVLRVEL